MLCAVMMTFNAWVYIKPITPFPDKYPTILIHQDFWGCCFGVDQHTDCKNDHQTKRDERRFTIPKIVQLIQAVTLTFIAVSGLSIALIDTPIFSVYSWVFSEGATKRETVGSLFLFACDCN
ncbi:cytochrome b/b6 domain-containing protein [Vibrio lentus]|nr:cytochrome b/b6 domain-containing protein [Vibrio lentus]